jgi:hypothetical protein
VKPTIHVNTHCQCAACIAPADLRSARDAYVTTVHSVGDQATPGFWTAFAQGKLAALEGRPITDNPWFRDSHSCYWEFERGYKQVAEASPAGPL